jgi:hypothetical protein
MKVSLWDTEIGNRLGRFATEEEALGFVRTMLATYPREKLGDLSLSWRDDEDRGHEVAGADLLDRAERAAKTREPVKAGGGSSSDDPSPHASGHATRTTPIAASPRRGGD